jgi:hypothetical protein
MQILLPASPDEAYEARQWFVALPMPFRRDLAEAVYDVEGVLGPCDVYVETVLERPRGSHSRHNQVDLLFCFDRLIVSCEIKNHPDPLHVLDKATKQLQEHQNIIESWTRLKPGVYPVLFCPAANAVVVRNVSRALALGKHHIRVAGAEASLKHAHSDDDQHPLYLPEVLRQMLRRPHGRAQFAKKAIAAAVTTQGRKLLPFSSIADLSAHLVDLPDIPRIYPRHSWHIPDLRAADRLKAEQLLLQHGIIEIVGPPGVGKSSLIADVIDHRVATSPGCDEARISLDHCANATQVAAALLADVEGQAPGASDIGRSLDRLLSHDRIVWIEQRDACSNAALGEFLRAIRTHRAPGRANWVIESHVPILPELYRLEIHTLAPADIHRILERARAGAASPSAEEAVRRSCGNPRVALSVWMSESPVNNRSTGDVIAWFVAGLTPSEAMVAPHLARLVSIAPLGLPFRTLETWAERACPSLTPSAARNATVSLLDGLGASQLAHIENIRSTPLGPVANASDEGLGLLHTLDLEFVAAVNASLTPAVLQDAEAHLYDTPSGAPDELLAITLELNVPNLEPFCRSVFRRTHLAEMLAWIDRRGFVSKLELVPDQLSAYRCLVALHGAFADRRPSREEVSECLARAGRRPGFAHYAAAVLEGVALGLERSTTQTDIDAWKARCSAETDLDLRCEMVVRLAAAFAGLDRHEESWRHLQEALAMEGVGSGARSLAVAYTLGELNRTKIAFGVMDSVERLELVERLARELFEIGARIGNHRICGDAVFYYTRSREYALARDNALDEDGANALVAMLPALEFVERVGPTRRTQALLTQASIHRHTARWEGIPLSRFMLHADSALHLCRRAARRAAPRGHVTYALNAAGYMLDVCNKLFRFKCTPVEASKIVDHARLASREIAAVVAVTSEGPFVGADRELSINLLRGLPFIGFVVASCDRDVDLVRGLGLGPAVTSVADEVANRNLPGRDRTQLLASFLSMASRAMEFARSTEPDGYERAMRASSGSFIALVDRTSDFVKRSNNKKLGSAARRFATLLATVPPIAPAPPRHG